ncbi:MAG: biotin attachment protein, partial [Myxococcales bacterium]|nr:biotin attachment protein [Myxococcales bacterium]
YWNAEATMLMHTRGVLIMTTDGSMVLTGKKALEVSGSVAAEDERGIGGYERIMGPNGQAQYSARNLGDAYRILFEHYAYTYVVPGEKGVRRQATADPVARSVLASPYRATAGESFETVGDIFSAEANPGRKKPFAIREVMQAVVDADGGVLERYADMEGAETALVWDAHVGGHAACVIGFEGRSLTRRGAVPLDGPDAWTAGTLFPTGSKKVARAIRQASGNRPVVCLANLSGFDGSPESMRRLQLELGAEIGRAVVDFDGSIVFVVVSRYHGGAYVVFSKALNDRLVAMAVEGSYASVIGGAPAAAVVFPRDVQRRAERDPRMQALRDAIEAAPPTAREGLVAELEVLRAELVLEHQGAVAREFDAVHTVQRAVAVGSLDAVVAPAELRPAIVQVLDKAAEQDGAGAAKKSRRASPVAVG